MTATGVNTHEQELVDGGPRTEPEIASAEPAPKRPRWRWLTTTGRSFDAAVAVVYLLGSLYIWAHVWSHIEKRYMRNSLQDQTMYEWFFMYVARSVTHLQNPLYTYLQNTPEGVNMMANTPMLGVSIPLTPVTLLFGPTVAYTVVLVCGLTASAWAWYWLFSRHVVTSRVAALFGAGFCAFAPPIISHANGHANWIAHFLIPVIVWRTIKLREPGKYLRNGLILGALLVYQVFMGEEVLFLSALGLASFMVLYVIQRPSELRANWRPFLAGLAVAGLMAGVLLAYPLWLQMFGPNHYNGLPLARNQHNDLSTFFMYGSQTVAGDPQTNALLAVNTTEENSFFGWSVLLLVAGLTVMLWRRSVAARSAVITAVGFSSLSLGYNVMWNGKNTGIPGPWRAIDQLPLFDSILPSRLSLVAVPCIGLLIVLGIERLITMRERPVLLRAAIATTMALLLVPILPIPLPVRDRPPIPEFFSKGIYRQYVRPGRAVVAAPLPDAGDARPLDWQVATKGAFNLAEGYFVGPHGPDKHGAHGADRRPTSKLIEHWMNTAGMPVVTDADRVQAREDLRYWRADVVVLQPDRNKDKAFWVVEALLGEGQWVGGVWVWDVRSITS